ncbi:hypothetical protein TGME49_229900 [Toxoplasma gondii ME49]|uniref:Macro domain-containing protein n=3 Tax=Toxoplasma gondii TaxID=5811 RepID=A0A0F7V1S4_TOXGV|nr:hypothetical protein TGME49_229900 [Toxoplasma gondii ME49]EPT29064.1 hypothetical protein TGME49_229900 [Toxoplasma gondii ME49]ESS35689.1 hypothetical protein TGVEG_229900 [Toxoplasma gondii VEG]KYF45963.1 hypothetical protein TGARI_229900 [Toxoplasma gondii ARI]CEL74733.1 TPA: hypothetical protein BN1205_025610 [Toxoplasma gondii VEG]|eukprot:XP_018636903.1 hypothetical protein TGME49_229900 [Toxoplasma gondii ME49]
MLNSGTAPLGRRARRVAAESLLHSPHLPLISRQSKRRNARPRCCSSSLLASFSLSSVSSPVASPPSAVAPVSLSSGPLSGSVSRFSSSSMSPFSEASFSVPHSRSFVFVPARPSTFSRTNGPVSPSAVLSSSFVCSSSLSSPFSLASSAASALASPLGSRNFSSSHLSRKLRLHQERASRGHIEYLRQLERPPTPSPFPLPPSPSPSSPASAAAAKAAAFAEQAAAQTPEPSVLVRSAEEWIKRDFFFPLSHQPDTATAGEAARALERELGLSRGDEAADAAPLLLSAEGPQYGGLLQQIELPGFGEINVVHGDLLSGSDREALQRRAEEESAGRPGQEKQEGNVLAADAMLVPVPPNFLPYRGFGLEVLERGGPALQKAAFVEVKRKLQQREVARDLLSGQAGREEGAQREGSGLGFLSRRVAHESASEGGLDPGDLLLTPTFGVCPRVSLLAFLVTPYYWQGNSTEAARRLRFTMRRALDDLNRQGPGSLLLPFVGIGLYGYEPRGAAEILVESAVEQLLQVDAVDPNYTLRKITFVDRDATNAALLAEAAQAAKRAWLPEHQVVPAPVYWSQKQRRLLDVTDGMLMFCRKHTRLSFKKHHGVIRRQKTHYFSNVRPFLWRSSRVLEPPPLLLYRHSGKPADWQLPARPFYRQGVSGLLFPPRLRRGFPSMRVNSKGQFVGVNKMPYIAEKAQPRL